MLFARLFVSLQIAMEKIRIDVVGLHHWDVRDCYQEYAAKAVGKQLVLQPDPENVKDAYAVSVREGSLDVGYVAVPDLDVVHQALKGAGKQRLRGIVVESNPKPPVLTVEVEVERIDWGYEPFDDSVYKGWHYDGLSLVPRELKKMNDVTGDLMDALMEEDAQNGDTLLKLTRELLDSNLYDPSREMTRARYQLERLLSARPEPDLQAAAHQLRHQKGLVMSHENRKQVARFLFLEYPQKLRKRGLEECHYTYDNRLDELEEQLRAFPYQLYDKFLSDPVDFLREVYYKHVPRRHLFLLLSGIVLMILKGRVEIRRWGREGDTEPIEQIQSLASKMSPTERERAIKESIKELLEKNDKNGKPIVAYKSQWAGILSVLQFEFGVECDDLRALCSMMNDWGFGRESKFKCYCDYDSVVKSSTYATRHFKEWRGKGRPAHKRQVLAATELRVILRKKVGYGKEYKR